MIRFSPVPLQPVTIASDGSGGYNLQNGLYAAHVASDGYLDSFVVSGTQTITTKFDFGNPRFSSPAFSVVGAALNVTYASGVGTTFQYLMRPDGLTITFNNKRDGFSTFTWPYTTASLGCELLNDKGSRYAGDSEWFVTSGEVRGLPALYSERQQLVRWHFNRFALETHFEIWNVQFNFEEAGHLQNRTWTRNLIEQNVNSRYVIAIRNTSVTATLAAVPFTPTTTKTAGLYYTTDAITWTMDLGAQANYQYLLNAGISSLALSWTVWDAHDQQVATGTGTVTLAAGSTNPTVTINTGGQTGYFLAQFALTDASGQMLASSLRTRFAVIRQTSGVTNRQDSLTYPYTDYAQVAMIGAGAIREGHGMGEHFTQTNPNDAVNFVTIPGASPTVWFNKTNFDAMANNAATQAGLYGLTVWYQIVGTTAVTTSQLQAIAQYLTTNYRTRFPTMEVENEPNFIYSPAQYSNVLAAFAAGVTAAGGGVSLLAPACVDVSNTITFLTQIYADGRGSLISGVSTHTYPGPYESWEQFGNPAYLASLRALMTAHGDGAKPIWQTEQGYRWDLSPRAEVARYVARQFLQGWMMGILPSRHYYFYPQFNGFESWYEANGGEVGNRGAWLPHAVTVRIMAENLAGRSFSASLATPYKGIYAARFTGGVDDVVVLWTYDFPCILDATVPGLLSVQDWMGNAVTPGNATVTSTGINTLGYLAFTLEEDASGPNDKSFALSGEPLYVHITSGSTFTVLTPSYGTNFALASAGATAFASTEEQPAANAIDGVSDSYTTRTRWITTQTSVSPADPAWIVVNFSQPQTVSRFFALCEAVTVSTVPADWQFQVDVGGTWTTVVTGVGTDTWVLSGTFAPVLTSRVRLFITKNNDGWFRTSTVGKTIVGGIGFTQYTGGKVMISSFEIYA